MLRLVVVRAGRGAHCIGRPPVREYSFAGKLFFSDLFDERGAFGARGHGAGGVSIALGQVNAARGELFEHPREKRFQCAAGRGWFRDSFSHKEVFSNDAQV